MPSPSEERRLERERGAKKPKSTASAPENPVHEGEEWDAIDEAAWESFPASDPPSHWAGADEPEEADRTEEDRDR